MREPAQQMSPELLVRRMTHQDTPWSAALHRGHLGHGFLLRLGPAFVRRWHETFVDCEAGVALVAEQWDGTPVAFLVGTIDQSRYLAEVLHQHKRGLVVRAVAGLLLRPFVCQRFLRTRTRRYLRRLRDRPVPVRTTSTTSQGPPTGVIHAIVTLPHERGRGAGRLLVEAFLELLRCAGTGRAELVTSDASGAVEFYRRMGWSQTDTRRNKDGGLVHVFSVRP